MATKTSVNYLHGAYATIQAIGTKVAANALNAIVYVGTAPVQTVSGGKDNVNVPILVNNIAEARKYFGYSEEWDKYTLCEAMHAHFELNAVGPLVLINVLDCTKHKATTSGTASPTPVNGRATITDAADAVLDTLVVKSGSNTLVNGVDFTAAYDYTKGNIVLTEKKSGALGTAALTITFDKVDATKVTDTDVIGEKSAGQATGVYAISKVYQETGKIPAFLLAPGFADTKAVHTAMLTAATKVNGHWDAYILADLPLSAWSDKSGDLSDAAEWKTTNGYNNANETVYFPMANGTDGNAYHLSVLAAANLQSLLVEQDGIPYKTASNTECAIIKNLKFADAIGARTFDDEAINNSLNANGIASAAYAGGHWVIWGCHSADYSSENNDKINVSETNRMMLYYISNDFQHRRMNDVDKPMTANGLKTIVSEEQTRLDALVKIGALTYGVVSLNASADAKSDIMNGDYTFAFNVTTTPLAKSLTALVNWTDEGFTTYFADLT